MPVVQFHDASAKNCDAKKFDAQMQLQIVPNTNLSSSGDVIRELVVIHHIPKPPPDLSIAHRERPGLSVLGFEVMYKLFEKLRKWPELYPTFHHLSRTMMGRMLRELRADTRRVTENHSLSYIPVKASAALDLPARVAHAILLMNEHRKRPPRDGRLCLMCGGRAVFDNREDLSSFPDEGRPVDLELGCKYQSGVGHWVVMGVSLLPGFGEGSSSKLCHRHRFHVQRMFYYLMLDDDLVDRKPRTPLDASEARERYIGRYL